jgi:hypothetical protein
MWCKMRTDFVEAQLAPGRQAVAWQAMPVEAKV